MDTIIGLGNTCNVSFAMCKMKLRAASTLFEWFVSTDFEDILKVLEKLHTDGVDGLRAVGSHIGSVKFEGTMIYSGHYAPNVYQPIMKRRAERLLDDIHNHSKNCVFMRIEDKPFTTFEQVEKFFHILDKIDPDHRCFLILIQIGENMPRYEHPRLFHAFFHPRVVPCYQYWHQQGDIQLWETVLTDASLALGLSIKRYDSSTTNDKDI